MSESSAQKIGRYEIEREIGRGGMAIVYKAFDPRLERPVAIKLIKMSAFGEDAFGHVRERFEREAKALARLDHPNILRVHDFGDHEGAPYLVMDYIEGSTLKELKKPVRVDTAVKLLTPIADALEYVHAQGLLHRDVKPSNIMITRNGRVILTDFGIVKWLEEDGDLHTLTATGVGIGTPEYMSPEQGRGMKIDARSDMYSLSIVFYEVITGRKPFTADTPVNILLKQISEPLPDPRQFVPEISSSVRKFLDRAAAKDPEDRYPTTKEYLLDFEGLRLQAQTNRAVGQANSGFQSLPRKTESTASSLEIGKSGLDEVREKVGELPTVQPDQTSFTQPAPARSVPTKRIPWGALTFVVVALAVIFGGYFGLKNRGKSSVAETREAIELAMMAATAESARMTSEAGRATAEVEAITATKAKEEQVLTGTAEREARSATSTAEREAQIAIGTIGAELTAVQATFEQAMRATERVVTYEAMIAETQAALTAEAYAVTRTAEANAAATQESVSATEMAFVRETQTAEAEATRVAQAQTATQIAKYQVGDIIKFGRYEQDNDLNNGMEEIEWRILTREGDKALIISVMGLDAIPYNDKYKDVTWEESSLRAWLNSEFYDKAFNNEERVKIERTTVVNEDNPSWDTKGGNDTEEHVFLLSIDEVQKYISNIEDRVIKPTKYAITNRAWTDSDNGNGWWWLRSIGFDLGYAVYVYSDGVIYFLGLRVYNDNGSVRPAMWINIGN